MKLPPIEKVYEAWSALADDRVAIHGNEASVTSSDGAKTYAVVYNPETNTFRSTDAATVWQHYPGYPVIAVMMKMGMLPVPADIKPWKGINWNALNKKYRRNYAAAVEAIETERHIDGESAHEAASRAMDALEESGITVGRLAPR